jgi:hypothetical protein
MEERGIGIRDVDFVYEHKNEATQVVGLGGQAVARGSSL